MESPGVTFTLQWRKYGTVNCRKNITKIGLWDPDASKLDWRSFKTYVCQNLGVVEDIDLSYIDSGEEDLPIDSEQEFREALKLARRRACCGKETVLKVHQKRSSGCNMPNNVVPGHVKSVVNTFLSSTSKPTIPQIEAPVKIISRKNSSNSLETIPNQEKMINKGHKINFMTEKFETKNKDHTEVLMSLLDKLQKLNLDPVSTPPSWFHSYMRKFKGEIIAEVTTNFLHEVQQAMRNQTDYNEARNNHSCNLNKNAYRQRVLTQILSGGEIPNDSNELKLLKEIQKLRRREKKLERKFDFKLRKLEHKTKKIIEKRSRDRMPYRRLVSLQRSGELQFSAYLMDAVLLNDCQEVIVSPGEHFTKVWEVKNTGNLSWTDKTDLRQVWGSNGLEPENIVTDVPPLQPGEVGTILMEFRAPDSPGSCNSYWHFHHKGEKFGHWLACSVIVKESTETPLTSLHAMECQLTRKNIQSKMIANFCSEDAIDISKHEMKKCLKESTPSLNQRLKGNIESEAPKVIHFLGPSTKISEIDLDSSFPPCMRSTQQLSKTGDTVVKSLLKESKALDNIRYDGRVKYNYSEKKYRAIEFDSATHMESKNHNSHENDNSAEKIKKSEFDRMSKQKDASYKNDSYVKHSEKSEVDKARPMSVMNSFEKNNSCEKTKKNEFDRTNVESKHRDISYENKDFGEKSMRNEFDNRTHVDSKCHNNSYENNIPGEKSKNCEFDKTHESKHRNGSHENIESVENSKKSEFDGTTRADLKHNNHENNHPDEKSKKSEFDKKHTQSKCYTDTYQNDNSWEKTKKSEFHSRSHSESKRHNDSYEDIRREKVYVVDPSGRCFAFKPQNSFSNNSCRDICSVDDPCGSCFAFSYAHHACPDGSKMCMQGCNTRMNGPHSTQCSTGREKRQSTSPTKVRGYSCKHKPDKMSSSMHIEKRIPSSTRSSKTNVILNNTMNYRESRQYPSPNENVPRPYRTGDENLMSDESYMNVKCETRAPYDPTNHNVSLINVRNLPARVVSGATTVASTALNAARSVVNTCKESLQECCQRSPERRSDTSDHLDLLEKMGFKDSLLNFQLLHKYNNDINKVLSVLLTLSDND